MLYRVSIITVSEGLRDVCLGLFRVSIITVLEGLRDVCSMESRGLHSTLTVSLLGLVEEERRRADCHACCQ